MENSIEKLLENLKQDERLVANGELKENYLVQLILQNDEKLISRLIEIDDVREDFFVETKFGYTFLQDKFLKFLSGKSVWLNSYTRYRNKIGLSSNNELLKDTGKVVIDFPYKDCVLEGGQTKEEVTGGKKEVFYNATIDKKQIDRLLEQKALTNIKCYSESGVEEELTWSDKSNLILKGNNLIALKSIEKKFEGQIKLIFIDPPYNTKQDSFKYNDKFTRSTWLTFMKNRLEIAKNLLVDSGAIFIQISDKEQAYLKVLCDEIFGEENFINLVTVKTKSPSGFKTVNLGVFETAEYILVYGKNKKKWKYKTQYEVTNYDANYSKVVLNRDERYSDWKMSTIKEEILKEKAMNEKEYIKQYGNQILEEEIEQYALNNANRVFRLTTINSDAGNSTIEAKELSLNEPERIFKVVREDNDSRYVYNGQEIAFYSKKVREIDGELVPTKLLTNIWTDIPWEGIAKEGNVTLKKGKKPERLLKRIIDMSTDEGDYVMDFFLGSGTTCAVAHKMNRRYIGIEQLNYGENDSVIRLQNVINGDQTGVSKVVGWEGGGSFIYAELMKYNQLYVDKIMDATTNEQLLAVFAEIKDKGFLNYRVNLEKFNTNDQEFCELQLQRQKEILIEFLDQNQLYVNYSDIDDEQFQISDSDRKFMQSFYEGGE